MHLVGFTIEINFPVRSLAHLTELYQAEFLHFVGHYLDSNKDLLMKA